MLILEGIEGESHFHDGNDIYHTAKVDGVDVRVKFLYRDGKNYEPHFKVNHTNTRNPNLNSGTANKVGLFVLHSVNMFIDKHKPDSLHFLSTRPEKLRVYDRLADILSKRYNAKIVKVSGGSKGMGRHLYDKHTAVDFQSSRS